MSVFETVKNIDALRALVVAVPADHDRLVYVEGYYEKGDGGEGFFIFKSEETVYDVGGIFIMPNSFIPEPPTPELPPPPPPKLTAGRWVRRYSGKLNVIYFGVVKFPRYYAPPMANPIYNYTNSERIQNALNYVDQYNLAYLYGNPDSLSPLTESPQDMTIYFPSGSYPVDKKVRLYREVNIQGDFATRLVPNEKFDGDYVFDIVPGPIEKFGIDKIEIDFGHCPNVVGGIHFKAQAVIDPKTGTLVAGGAANGTIKGIRMRRLKGHGIYLEGGQDDTTGFSANQYLHFEDIFIERNPGYYNCLRITGASYNNVFINCQLQIHFQTETELSDPGINIFISTENEIPQCQSDQIAFINCATGGVPQKGVFFGAKIEKARSITFENCWFEDTEIAISVTKSHPVNVLNCYFANAAGLGSYESSIIDHEGACVTAEDSFVNVERNYCVVGNPDSPFIEKELFIKGIGDNNVINARNNSFQDIRLSQTYGIAQTVTITDIVAPYYSSPPLLKSGIETGGKKAVLVKSAGTSGIIDRINSSIAAGETLFIRAEDGKFTINEWDPVHETNGRNIYLSGKGSITLYPGHAAMFMKLDGVNCLEKCSYQLISVVG